MKVKVQGYNCDASIPEDELPSPDEVQYFEGAEESIEAELAMFGIRFIWYKIEVIEWDKK